MPGYEPTDTPIKPLIKAAAYLAGAMAVVLLIVFGIFEFFVARRPQTAESYPISRGEQFPPEPRIEADPKHPLIEMRRQEHDILTTYGWVDKNSGVVRVPIDRAMDLTFERGLK